MAIFDAVIVKTLSGVTAHKSQKPYGFREHEINVTLFWQ